MNCLFELTSRHVTWMRAQRVAACAAVAMAVASLSGGCASDTATANREDLTSQVGIYTPGPAGVSRPRVGVPPFTVTDSKGSGEGHQVDALAADQMSTLLVSTDRFDVIERTQLQKLLDEQNLEGIVAAGEMAQPAMIRGVDYLLIGKVTNMRVKTAKNERGFGLAQLTGKYANLGGGDISKKEITITTECGVDIRLVDPTTGQIIVANFSDFKLTEKAGALGVDILGASAEADVDVELSEDDRGKILRLALDDAVRKSLPKIDNFLRTRPAAQPAAPTATVSQ